MLSAGRVRGLPSTEFQELQFAGDATGVRKRRHQPTSVELEPLPPTGHPTHSDSSLFCRALTICPLLSLPLLTRRWGARLSGYTSIAAIDDVNDEAAGEDPLNGGSVRCVRLCECCELGLRRTQHTRGHHGSRQGPSVCRATFTVRPRHIKAGMQRGFRVC